VAESEKKETCRILFKIQRNRRLIYFQENIQPENLETTDNKILAFCRRYERNFWISKYCEYSIYSIYIGSPFPSL